MKQSARIPTSALLGVLAIVLLAFNACGEAKTEASPPAQATQDESGLSADELQYGIGPIKRLSLGAVDPALAEKGEESFKMKCMACHKLGERYVGPALGDVLERRTPEYVMNMMLNPAEMVEKHPEAKKLFTQFLIPMPNQNLNEEEARALLEYLRHEAEKADEEAEEEAEEGTEG